MLPYLGSIYAPLFVPMKMRGFQGQDQPTQFKATKGRVYILLTPLILLPKNSSFSNSNDPENPNSKRELARVPVWSWS